jgi:hypothetical protein
LVAKANGGDGSDENCVVCCKTLNSWFGSKPLKEKFRVVLNQRGRFVCPRNIDPPTIAQKAPKPAEKDVDAAEFRKALSNLQARNGNLPKTLLTLTRTIASILQLQPSDSKTVKAIEWMKANKKILVDEKNKVTYSLKK